MSVLRFFLLGGLEKFKIENGGLKILNFQIGGPQEKMISFSQITQLPPCHK